MMSVLAEHYGFTEEKPDFIINDDSKYRMEDKLRKTTRSRVPYFCCSGRGEKFDG